MTATSRDQGSGEVIEMGMHMHDGWVLRRLWLVAVVGLGVAAAGTIRGGAPGAVPWRGSGFHVPSSAVCSASGPPARAAAARPTIVFEANRGQVDDQVRFVARAGRSTLFLTADAAVLALGGLGDVGRDAASDGHGLAAAVRARSGRHRIRRGLRLEDDDRRRGDGHHDDHAAAAGILRAVGGLGRALRVPASGAGRVRGPAPSRRARRPARARVQPRRRRRGHDRRAPDPATSPAGGERPATRRRPDRASAYARRLGGLRRRARGGPPGCDAARAQRELAAPAG